MQAQICHVALIYEGTKYQRECLPVCMHACAYPWHKIQAREGLCTTDLPVISPLWYLIVWLWAHLWMLPQALCTCTDYGLVR